MKANALLSMAVIVTLSLAASRADSYNCYLVPGANFIANELNDATGNYVSNVLRNLPAGDSVLKFNSTSQAFFTAQKSDTLNPGEGAVVMHVAGTAILSVTGTAAVAQPPLTLNPGQFRLVGRRAGGLGPSTYEELVGGPPVEGSTLLAWNPALQDYIYYSYHNNQWSGPGGASSAPQIPAGFSALVVVQPAMTVTNAPGGQVVITWTAPATWTLEGADSVDGPWMTVPNATSPYSIPAPPQDKVFYRLHGQLGQVIGF